MCMLKIYFQLQKAHLCRNVIFPSVIISTSHSHLTLHLISMCYATLWELLNSKVPSNVCLQDSNCLALMIVRVQSNGHVCPKHLKYFCSFICLDSFNSFCFV